MVTVPDSPGIGHACHHRTTSSTEQQCRNEQSVTATREKIKWCLPITSESSKIRAVRVFQQKITQSYHTTLLILPPPFTQGIKLAFPWFPLENGFKDDDHETFEKTFQHGRQSSKQKQKLNHTHTHTGNAEETGAVQGMEKQLISMIDNRIYSCIK